MFPLSRVTLKFLVIEARVNSGFNKIGFYVSHVSKYDIVTPLVVRDASSLDLPSHDSTGSMMIVEFRSPLCIRKRGGYGWLKHVD